MKFEWKNFQEFTTLGILDKIQKTKISELKCYPEHFKRRIIFMSMCNDIDWGKRGNREKCIANAQRVTEYARRFTRGHWSFLGLDRRRNGTELTSVNLMENGIKLLKTWCSTLPSADIQNSVLRTHKKEDNSKAKGKE